MKACLSLALVAAACSTLAAPSETASVRLWETNLVLQTYEAAPPDRVPRFYSGRTYQGAQATFYPYPVQDRLTGVKTDKAYRALFLENDHIQISVLPELGGRIFSATDKANGYDFFYRQTVIKPALIGMLGAWISGGVEWNVPHHHRASSFMPVSCSTTTQADGSKTIWVGEIERRHRLKWVVGITVHPDRSYLELSCRVANRTPFAHPMLFWINPAVHANTNYQVLFPEGTEWVTQHGKPEFASWPVARQVYGGVDYSRGVDISWWKNHPAPVSFFAWNYEEDWFGGYDHGRQAGVLHVADHHVVPGKKFFEWGNGPEGELWTRVLSDGDGPYLELMAGAWSDNQPDYSWIQPGEVRVWKHWWYPVRGVGGVRKADRDLAVNFSLTNGAARVAVNATRQIADVEIALLHPETPAGTSFWVTLTNLGPSRPFSVDVPLKGLARPEQLVLSLRPGNSETTQARDSFSPLTVTLQERSHSTPMPQPVERPRPPAEYGSTDELYFTGQRIEQLHSPSFEAAPYYEEILRRDAGDYRANTALGISLCKQWRWEEAARYLSNAIGRATANHVRPKEGEAFYYLGVALRQQSEPAERGRGSGREVLKAAEDALQKAAWIQGWRGRARYELAEIACVRGEYGKALQWVTDSIAAGGGQAQARHLQATILRHLDQPERAEKVAREILAEDPLDVRALSEVALAQRQRGDPAWTGTIVQLRGLLGRNPEAYLENALDFANAGGWEETMAILQDQTILAERGQTTVIASEHYCLAYAYLALGDSSQASAELAAAATVPPDFSFPHRPEEIPIYRWATRANPADGRAPYYLGCLLYDRQPGQAMAAWEESRGRQSGFALVHRNLGLAYAQVGNDYQKALESMERALALQPDEPRFYYEMDVLAEGAGIAAAKRLERLTAQRKVVEERDDATTRLIVLMIQQGEYDPAIELLRQRHFRNWEGSREIHEIYVDAYLSRGRARLHTGRAADALADFEAAREYPENLEAARPYRNPRESHIFYHLGLAQEALGQGDGARLWFEKAIARKERTASEHQYFQGLALRKLGQAEEAERLFEGLIRAGEEQLSGRDRPDYFAKFGERQTDRVRSAQAHYLKGLGQLGRGALDRAQKSFQETLALHPAHLGATLRAKGW